MMSSSMLISCGAIDGKLIQWYTAHMSERQNSFVEYYIKMADFFFSNLLKELLHNFITHNVISRNNQKKMTKWLLLTNT